MSHDLRWAARYAFTEELWRGRPRVIVDERLEAALLDDRLRRAHDPEPLEDIVDALVPLRAAGDAPVWMGVADDDAARALKGRRQGVRFVPITQLPQIVTGEAWEVLLLDVDAHSGPSREFAAVATRFGLRPFEGRHLVLWGHAANGDREPGLDYGEFADFTLEHLAARGSTQRIYGLYRPSITAVVDFGESLQEDDAEANEAEMTLSIPREVVGGREDEIPLVFDNTLGAQEPTLLELVSVTSPGFASEGLTLVETPVPVNPAERGLRAQLASAQARVERVDAERQRLLGRVDELLQQNEQLELAVEQHAETASVEANASESERAGARDEALESALAREQALKWRVSELEQQLARAIARPVNELEAEIARLQHAATDAASDAGVAVAEGAGGAVAHDLGRAGAANAVPSLASSRRVAEQMQAVVRRLERGGIGVLELRRDLTSMARRLRGS